MDITLGIVLIELIDLGRLSLPWTEPLPALGKGCSELYERREIGLNTCKHSHPSGPDCECQPMSCDQLSEVFSLIFPAVIECNLESEAILNQTSLLPLNCFWLEYFIIATEMKLGKHIT